MNMLAIKPATEEIWRWLEAVPDPEIPVVSVVDLGIVRDVAWQGNELVVTVTPTYSGCPATAVISIDIEEALRRRGIEKVRIKTQLSPAWTTDWITDAARSKLREYGIAPPVDEAGATLAEAPCAGMLKAPPIVACPRCGSKTSKRISQFGSTPCKASYQCEDCLEPFDYFKSF